MKFERLPFEEPRNKTRVLHNARDVNLPSIESKKNKTVKFLKFDNFFELFKVVKFIAFKTSKKLS